MMPVLSVGDLGSRLLLSTAASLLGQAPIWRAALAAPQVDVKS
jgi:hypothetical protein